MPAIHEVSLEDVLADGRELGKSPAEIAEGVRKWRGLTLDWAAQNRADADPEKYVQGVDVLDGQTSKALSELRGAAAQQWAQTSFASRPQDYEAFVNSLDAEPTADAPFAAERQQLAELQQAFRLPKARQANQWEPLADKNGNELGRMQFIDRGGQQDVLLNVRTDTFGGRKAVRVPIPSVQDTEIEQAAAAAEAEAAKLKEQAIYHLSFPPETGYNGADAADVLERQAKQQTQRAATLRSQQGRSLLTSERVMQAVRENPELSKQIGKSGLGEDIYRGMAQFFVSSRVAFNDVTGDTAERDEWRGHLQNMRQYFPGSTGPANTEGVRGFVSDAAAGAGGMAPQALAMAAGGVPAMSGAAVRGIGAASLGSMGVSAYGGAVDETLNRADAMDAEAETLEATDPKAAQQLREQAAGIREGYRGIAAAKAGVEVASEFILPEQRLLRAGGTGMLNRMANATVKSLGEGAVAEIGNQAVNSAVFGDPIDLEQIARGAALEAAAGAPMIAASALAPNGSTNPNDNLRTNQTPAAPAPEGPARGSMLDIAMRAGMENPVPPKRQPILTGVPDRAAPFRDQPLNQGVPEMAGDVVTDLRIPRSPEAIAESQRIEQERQTKVAEMRMLDARATGMPVIADSPTGSRDILDFANENPIYLPPGFSEDRKLPEYEALGRNPLPPYWRQFVASGKQGGNPDSIAQRAFDAGMIAEPTADAYIEALQEGIAGRKQYRVQFQQREKDMAQEERRVVDFEKTQDKLAKKPQAQEVPFEDIVTGDRMTIDGEQAVVKAVEYNEDGYLTNVVIEDGTRFGLMQFDPQTRGGLLVDEYQPRGTTASTPATEPTPPAAATRAAVPAASPTSGGEMGTSAAMAPGAGAVNLEDLNAELQQLAGGRLQFSKAAVSSSTAAQGSSAPIPTKATADAVKLLAERLPHLTNGKLRTYADAAAFLADAGYHRGQGFTSAELAALEGAEAFYDNLTGSTVVLLNQIGLREGETPIRAVARVLLHERVGHEGVNALLKDSTEAAKWDKLAGRIPHAELDGIATEPGYTHLAGDRGQLALEWLARQTERIEGARNAAAIEGGLSGVAKQLWQALKELLGKVFANFSRSAALASEVAEIITRARAAQMAGTALPMTAEAMATRLQMSWIGDKAIRGSIAAGVPLHEAGTPFEVSPRRLALRTILTGSPLPRALKEVVMTTDNERKALDASFARIGDLMRVAAEGVAARTGTPLADVYAQVNAYLEGQPGAQAVLMNVDEGLAEASRRARNMLDDMTQAIANTLPNSDLRATMIGNMGSWMRRGYAAFDEASGWNFKGVLAAARAGKQLAGKDAARIMREAAAFLETQDATLQGQRDASGLPREGTLLHAEMKDVMDRDMWAAAMMGGAGVRKNTSSLMRRKDIPGQLRALMGEESNPLRKYAASGAFQAQFLARHQGQVSMRQLGLAQGLFQTQRGGDFNVEIPKDVKWSGMAGLWTTPELWAALQATSGTDLMGAGAGGMLLQGLYWLSNMAKLNRVALNPKSWAPNIYGGLVSLVQSGDVLDWHFMRRVGDAMRTMQAGKAKASDVRDAAAVGLKDAQRSLLSRLQAGGVINSNVMLRDIAASLPQSLMNFIERTDYGDKVRGAARGALLGNALARSTGGPLSLTRAAGIAAGAAGGAIAGEQRIQNVEQKIADFVLSGPDNLVKITGWLRNYEVALSAGMNAEQAEAQATERTLNTFPNYARLPALAREASRLGVIGSFVAFQVEVLRNYGHNWNLATRDLRSGNAALQADAMRRMIGLSSVTALAFGGLSGALTLLLGSTPPDDERNKKWRKWFAAPWEKDALLHFNSYDENGVSYFNPSYLVPQTTMAELVETLNQGLPPEEAAQRFLGRLWEQYGVGSSVHVSPLLAALTNQNRAGRPITYREGAAGAVERADYAAKVIADPGAASLLTELVYALQSKEVDGKTYTVEQLAKQLAGMRVQTQTWDHLLEMRYKAFSADYQNVRAEARRQIKAATSTPAQAMQWANTEITRLQSEVKAFEADLPQMNIPAPKAKTARKNSRLGTLSPVELTKDGKGLQAD
jgi:hypothetical protein